jgi:hypothetical protein
MSVWVRPPKHLIISFQRRHGFTGEGYALMERRKVASQLLQPERRKSENQNMTPDSHHILVIAIERQPGQPVLWRNGDRVLVVPKIRKPLTRPQEGGNPPPKIKKIGFHY